MKTETLSFNPLSGAEDRYVISIEGDVKSIMRKTINSIGRSYTCSGSKITPIIDRAGYWTVNVKITGVRSTHYVHRLVAQTFIENPMNKPFVNHRNGNKLDNRVDNLEWVTRKENYLHAIKIGLCKAQGSNSRPVRDRCTGVVYPSMYAVSLGKNIPYQEVKFLLKRKIDTCLEFVANAA